MLSIVGGCLTLMDVHPRNSWVLVGKASGELNQYNYLTNEHVSQALSGLSE